MSFLWHWTTGSTGILSEKKDDTGAAFHGHQGFCLGTDPLKQNKELKTNRNRAVPRLRRQKPEFRAAESSGILCRTKCQREGCLGRVGVVQSLSRVQLCKPMDCSTPDFPALHYLPQVCSKSCPLNW